MLSYLDRIVFPDRCEVIEVIPSQRYVYPIFKNGSSSLYHGSRKYKWRIRINEQIKHINNIDIIIREPQDRLISGVNTFIQHTLRDYPDLDRNTVEWFSLNYLYLNRHYCPQFFWLVNLARYISQDCRLNFLSMQSVDEIATNNKKPEGVVPPDAELIERVGQIKNIEMYQRIENIIYECIGKSMTFNQLIAHIKQLDSSAYDYVVGHAQKILTPCIALD